MKIKKKVIVLEFIDQLHIFIKKPENYFINYIDMNKLNNNCKNLEKLQQKKIQKNILI